MNSEQDAWSQLRAHAASRLGGEFPDRVLRSAQGCPPGVWHRLGVVAAGCLRPGFADRVVAAARQRLEIPSYGSQFALSAVTAAVCLAAVIFFHHRELAAADARNLAEWRRIVAAAQDLDAGAR
ncbi:MAG: hypothetical protein ACO3G4_11320 [Opitutaceae bacterium]